MGDFYLGTSRGSRTFSNPETTGSSNDLAGLLLPNNNDAAGSPDGSGDYEPPRRLSPRRMSTGSRLRKSRISEGSGVLGVRSNMPSAHYPVNGNGRMLVNTGLMWTVSEEFDEKTKLKIQQRILRENSVRSADATGMTGVGAGRSVSGGVGRFFGRRAVQNSVDLLVAPVKVQARLNVLWVFISCGYMVAFTAIGSLIAYFKATQGANFYTYMYCVFYLPGLPISLLQQRFDEGFDERVGSQNAFFTRVTIGMAVQAAMLCVLPSLEPWPFATLIGMGLIGAASWICHGTACQLCAMFPPSSTAYLQTGFRTPELYALAAVYALNLDADATQKNVAIFYYLTALWVVVGTIAWVAVVGSMPATVYFKLKDYGGRGSGSSCLSLSSSGDAGHNNNNAVVAATINHNSNGASGGGGNASLDDDVNGKKKKTLVDGFDSSPTTVVAGVRSSSDCYAGVGGVVGGSGRSSGVEVVARDDDEEWGMGYDEEVDDDDDNFIETSNTQAGSGGGAFDRDSRDISSSFRKEVKQQQQQLKQQQEQQEQQQQQQQQKGVRESGVLLRAVNEGDNDEDSDDNDDEEEEEVEDVATLIHPCRVAIFTNICSSIFTAAFYVYVPTTGGPFFGKLGGPVVGNVEVVLYFVRLFSDLLGRPLAGLPRPKCLATKESLKNVSSLRVVLSIAFFIYILQPGPHSNDDGDDDNDEEFDIGGVVGQYFPKWLRIPHSDALIVVLVGVYSALSGYLNVLAYEYAAGSLRTKQGQSTACALMNITFQLACFVAVVMSVAIVALFFS